MTAARLRSEEAGRREIRREELSDSERYATILPGARVIASDRGNVGTVLTVDEQGSTATVGFCSPHGAVGERTMPLADLTLITDPSGRGFVAKPRDYVLLSLDDLQSGDWPEYLVDGLLDHGNLCVLYGAAGSFKSFLAIDLALHLALGWPWHNAGHSTKPSRALYVAGEGQVGLRLRVSAWLRHRFDESRVVSAVRERFFAIGDAVPLVDPSEPDNLIEFLRGVVDRMGGAPDLIVLDTLARCFIGGDENSSRDMGRFVDACDQIRKETGAAILAIHHTGKDGALERGSSALRAGADVMLKVAIEERDGVVGAARLCVEKRKDGPQAEDLVFDLHVVPVVVLPDGRQLTSLVPMPSTSAPAPEAYEPRRQRRRGGKRRPNDRHQSISILTSLAMVFDRNGASATNIIADSEVPRSTAYRRLAALHATGHVDIHDGRGTDIYTITPAGLEWLSRESPQSLSLSVSETLGVVSPVSPVSTPPLKGGGDETETHSETHSHGTEEFTNEDSDAGAGPDAEATGEEATGEEATGEEATGEEATGEEATE